jgi:hypothetical protein
LRVFLLRLIKPRKILLVFHVVSCFYNYYFVTDSYRGTEKRGKYREERKVQRREERKEERGKGGRREEGGRGNP